MTTLAAGAASTPPAPLPATGVARLIGAGFLVVGLGFGGVTAWSALAPIHSAINAAGALVPESGRKTVRHPTGGPIVELPVRGGDHVKAGQVLIRLDDTEERTRLDMLAANWRDALALEARLLAELAGAEGVMWPEALAGTESESLRRNQQTLFDVRRGQLASETRLSGERIAALEAQKASLAEQRLSVERELAMVGEELQVNEDLLARGNGMRARVVELRRDAARLDARLREVDTDRTRLEQQQTETRGDLEHRRNEFREKVLEELEKARSEVGRQAEQMRDAANRLANRTIKAPEEGIAVLAGHPVAGGTVAPNEAILDIVPTKGDLVAEVKVAPKDIKALSVGLPVKVQLVAFDSRVVGAVGGVVDYVSADRIADPMTRVESFLVRIRLDGAVGDTVRHLKIKVGMPVDANITLAGRTPLDYLITPLKQSYLKAFIQE
jgi:HlyD family type I secretion membrane fusion protein